jgi:hypothetical protein
LRKFVGTALLLAAVVGSGIMGERLAAGNVASVATFGLLAVIWECSRRRSPAVPLVLAQVIGTAAARHCSDGSCPLFLQLPITS